MEYKQLCSINCSFSQFRQINSKNMSNRQLYRRTVIIAAFSTAILALDLYTFVRPLYECIPNRIFVKFAP